MKGGLLLLLLTTMVDITAAGWMLPTEQTYDGLLIPSQVAPVKSKRTAPNNKKGTSLWKPRFFGEFEYTPSSNAKWRKSSSCLANSFIPDVGRAATTNQNNDEIDKNKTLGSTSSTRQNCNTADKMILASRKQEAVSTNTDTKNRQANGKRKRRKMKNKKNNMQLHDSIHGNARFGNLPDIEWRAIPMEHLRAHPSFIPLPKPETIERLEEIEEARSFRQDSWQWDALHAGRCTTSQTVAALGFLEPNAGKFLMIPKSWWRGGTGAFYRLRERPLSTLEEMNSVLCSHYGPKNNEQEINSNNNSHVESNKYWSEIPPGQRNTTAQQHSENTFIAKYMMTISSKDKERRRNFARKLFQSPGNGMFVRRMWGTKQEATSLLTALNYFAKNDSGMVLREIGMCGAGVQQNSTSSSERVSSLLVGASPDALLCSSNGNVEVLEVKNHCPYSATTYTRNSNKRNDKYSGGKGGKKRFRANDFVFYGTEIQTQYVPQLMMEMLCVGENCRSAVMVRQTATNGARILRMKRNDAWIDEMLYWLHKFQIEFVEKEIVPPQNFFFDIDDEKDKMRYIRFLEWTKDLASRVDLIAHLPNSDIQRATGANPGDTPLFLD